MVSFLIMPIAGLITGTLVQPKYLIFCSLLGIATALYVNSGLDLNISFWDVSFSRMIQVLWLPLVFIPLSAVQFTGIPPKENNNASAIINLMRNLGGSWGVSVATTELQRRTQFHFERLGESITPFSGFPQGHDFSAIGKLVQTQSSILSYLDVFWLLGLVAAIVCPLALFLPNVKGASGGH